MGKFADELGKRALNLLDAIGSGFKFTLGLVAVILIACLSLSGEIISDLTTYKDSMIDWLHVSGLVIPVVAKDIIQYVYHKQAMGKALSTEPPKE